MRKRSRSPTIVADPSISIFEVDAYKPSIKHQIQARKDEEPPQKTKQGLIKAKPHKTNKERTKKLQDRKLDQKQVRKYKGKNLKNKSKER